MPKNNLDRFKLLNIISICYLNILLNYSLLPFTCSSRNSNDKKDKREILRQKLENLGFLKLQESVYVFPFECLNEIRLLKKMYFLGSSVQYLLVERIETEIDLLSKFYNRGILDGILDKKENK